MKFYIFEDEAISFSDIKLKIQRAIKKMLELNFKTHKKDIDETYREKYMIEVNVYLTNKKRKEYMESRHIINNDNDVNINNDNNIEEDIEFLTKLIDENPNKENKYLRKLLSEYKR